MNIILSRNPARALTALAPFHRHMSLLDEIEGLAREAWGSWQPVVVPHLEMYEEKDNLVVKVELPCIKKKELDITLDGDMLTIKAEKKQEKVSDDATYHARELYYGQYSRSTLLPFPVDGDKISATLDKGLLEIRLPKVEQEKAKQIKVKAQLPHRERKKRQQKPKQKAN